MAQSVALERGVINPAPDMDESDIPEVLSKEDIERLGRQRPVSLPTAYTEVGFVFAVVASMMMSEYFISGFNIILPDIADALQIPDSERTWPAGVPNLTTAALLLPFARMCDRYGARVVFISGHVWLFIWSLISGFSQNSLMLIICRAMQGIGNGAFLPAGLALLGQTYRPGPRKNLVYGLYGACAVIGFYIGIILGAVAGELLNWRWYFWIGDILVFIVAVSGFLTIPRNLGDGNPNLSLDWLGITTIVPGLVLVVYALTDGGHAPDGWRTPYIYVTFIVGGLLLCAFAYIEGWISTEPLLPAEMFQTKYMKRLVGSLFCSFGVFGVYLFYASYYIETVLNRSPLDTAAWFTPLCVGGLCLAIIGGFVMHLLPGRVLLLISGVGYIISVLLFALIPEQTGPDTPSLTSIYWSYVFPAMLCSTIGVDIMFNVTNVFITTAMPRRLQATAAAVTNSLLYLGMAFWLGVAELAVSTAVDYHGEEELSLRQQYKIGFWLGVGLAGVALCLTATIKIGEAASELTADEKEKMNQNNRPS
ncbi:major facilitator superfamily domain-containing protein [Biscogniauxia sp. FL1348]|nr:major facilitator superfamily domain-containing protein [Biscogniauxia sp. FL1348]